MILPGVDEFPVIDHRDAIILPTGPAPGYVRPFTLRGMRDSVAARTKAEKG